MKDIVFSLGKNVRTVLRANMLSVLIIHLVFITLGFILFTPLLGGLGRLLLSFSSQEVLADTDIIFFLLSPFGMTALVLFGAMLEHAGAGNYFIRTAFAMLGHMECLSVQIIT